MEPRIVSKPAATLVGLRYQGRNEHGEIGHLWEEFFSRMAEIPDPVDGCYGYSIMIPDAPEGEFEYVAGLPVAHIENLPDGLVARPMPAAEYAVFPCTIPTIQTVLQQAYREWLPAAGYQPAGDYMFELYDESFQGGDSVFDVYIPVMKVAEGAVVAG